MQALRTLVDSPQFTAGLVAGLGALVGAGGGVWWWTRARPRARPGVIGVAFAVAAGAAIGGLGPFTTVWPVPGRVVVGLAALATAGVVADRLPRPPLVGAVLAVPGGALLVGTGTGLPAWTAALLVLGPALAGTATADLDRRSRSRWLGPLLFLVAVAGMYTTVPDTELARAALGAALPVTLLAWPRARARLGRSGSYAAVGLFLWIAVLEGTGRPGSIVGAAACLGALVLEPCGRLLATGPTPRRSLPAGGLVVAQLALVAYFARVAGFAADAGSAALLAAPVAGAGVVASAVLSRPRSPSRRR